MTTKKILLIVVSIVVVLGLIVLIFVGGIVGSIFYGISNSEAAEVSREFLRSNAKLKEDIGEVREFGRLVGGNINIESGDGTAQLSLKVVGERKTVTAAVELMYRNGKPWRVIAASYKGDSGQTIDLLNPYEALHVGQTFLPVQFSLAVNQDRQECLAYFSIESHTRMSERHYGIA